MAPASPPDSALSLPTPDQYLVASQIIEAATHQTDQLVFLPGSARTGKTFTIKTLIKPFKSYRKKCLIYSIPGTAAAQYPRGATLHLLFRSGIDEQFCGNFRSSVGRCTSLARHILAADLTIT
jgi:excinuclease UvrABC helicase subunit UvrB